MRTNPLIALACNSGKSSSASIRPDIQCAVRIHRGGAHPIYVLIFIDYGDVAFRIYGNWARVGVNFLQSFQFFLNVVLIIESSGQGLAQMAQGASNTGFLCCEFKIQYH